MAACTRSQDWWYYHIIVGLITFFGGLLVLLPTRYMWYLCCKKSDEEVIHYEDDERRRAPLLSGCSRMRSAAIALISGHSFFSRVLCMVVFLLNLTAIVIYLVEASEYTISECGRVVGEVLPMISFALSIVFLLHYIIRFVAATDKTFFWLDIYSIVDHFTIGPMFMSFFLDTNWLGLRFLRLLYLLQLPEVLQMIHMVKSSSKIRLTQIGSIFIAIWLCSAGFVHLIENNGDPFHAYDNSQDLHYWECVYWLLITMSTVGFGDICPRTDIGRIFILLFIMGTFAMFTSIIPELARHLGHSTKYSKPYKRVYGKSHIVVCGYISYSSVSNFIRNFIHEDTGIKNTNVIFVDTKKPDLDLEAYFKRHMNDVTFLQGSVMEQTTLKNVKARYAEACLILANRNCDNPDEEDSANIMRATAIKNYSSDIRVIIQLLQHRNKSYLLHIPNWSWDKENGDDVICISELKLGLLAQNCLAPGVCTLMANLFTMRSFKLTNKDTWEDVYRYGAGNEIYSETFSRAFIGMSFKQVAKICFTKFDVLLLGVGVGNYSQIHLNPADMTISSTMIGFFIAQDPQQVTKVREYTLQPGSDLFAIEKNGNRVDMAPMNGGLVANVHHQEQVVQYLEYLEEVGSRLAFHSQGGSGTVSSPRNRHNSSERRRLVNMTSEEGDSLDVTGMFYWTQPRQFEDCVLDQDAVADHKFVNHVVLCLLADSSCPLLGLSNFIQPLRTAHIKREDLMDIVIMTEPDYIVKEWGNIASFPDVYVYQGDPTHRPDMRVLNLERASMVVVLSAKKHIVVDATMLDKETILTALNVKGMCGDNVEAKISTIGVLQNIEAFRNYMAKMRDIPLTVDLEFDENVAFLDQDDDDDPNIPLYMTHPYVQGAAFAASSLDALLSATYVNNQILTLIRALITGTEKSEMEQILAEALGIVRTHRDSASSRDKCHLTQLPLNSGLLAQLQVGQTYGNLFVKALREYGILCLGLYRLMEPDATNIMRARKRYVITSPTQTFPLLASDKVYCLQPYPNPDKTTKPTKKKLARNAATPSSPPDYDTYCESSYDNLDEPVIVIAGSKDPGKNTSRL